MFGELHLENRSTHVIKINHVRFFDFDLIHAYIVRCKTKNV